MQGGVAKVWALPLKFQRTTEANQGATLLGFRQEDSERSRDPKQPLHEALKVKPWL